MCDSIVVLNDKRIEQNISLMWHSINPIVDCTSIRVSVWSEIAIALCLTVHWIGCLRATTCPMMIAMEGPLCKWTNVMKGWQYRWYVCMDGWMWSLITILWSLQRSLSQSELIDWNDSQDYHFIIHRYVLRWQNKC